VTATRETRTARVRVREPLPRASLADTLAVGATVALPIVAQGVILRRPKVVALAESPAPFALASREKRAALSHFQPDGVLVSRGRQRADRRRFNQTVLEAHRPMHQLAAAVTAKVRQEARLLLDRASSLRRLDWDDFAAAFWRTVRRAVLGDATRDDHELTDSAPARERAPAATSCCW